MPRGLRVMPEHVRGLSQDFSATPGALKRCRVACFRATAGFFRSGAVECARRPLVEASTVHGEASVRVVVVGSLDTADAVDDHCHGLAIERRTSADSPERDRPIDAPRALVERAVRRWTNGHVKNEALVRGITEDLLGSDARAVIATRDDCVREPEGIGRGVHDGIESRSSLRASRRSHRRAAADEQ